MDINLPIISLRNSTRVSNTAGFLFELKSVRGRALKGVVSITDGRGGGLEPMMKKLLTSIVVQAVVLSQSERCRSCATKIY